ncbi:response regulator [Zhouia sp. PK063]|uniref:response regulator n=1 Tax=Zhouia sp. PK063 TaxID=3373602 RepID=UPI0037AB333E
MINEPLRILIIEDLPTDAALIQRQVTKIIEHPEIRVVDGLVNFKVALKEFIPDVVLSDYKLVGFNGLDVLHIMKEREPNTIFIFVTGTLNDEELAARTILEGASGYLLKNNINELGERLEPIIANALQKNKVHQEKLQEERAKRDAMEEMLFYLNQIEVKTSGEKERIKELMTLLGKIKKQEKEDNR